MTKTRTQVLLGLGVDDSFVLMEAFRRPSLDDNIVKRSATGMGHAGKLLLFECVCVCRMLENVGKDKIEHQQVLQSSSRL